MHLNLAILDSLQNDRAGVERELAVVSSKPEGKTFAVGAERQMAYYDGKVAAGRKLLQSQIEILQSTGVRFVLAITRTKPPFTRAWWAMWTGQEKQRCK